MSRRVRDRERTAAECGPDHFRESGIDVAAHPTESVEGLSSGLQRKPALRNADLQVCRVADLQICSPSPHPGQCRLENLRHGMHESLRSFGLRPFPFTLSSPARSSDIHPEPDGGQSQEEEEPGHIGDRCHEYARGQCRVDPQPFEAVWNKDTGQSGRKQVQ